MLTLDLSVIPNVIKQNLQWQELHLRPWPLGVSVLMAHKTESQLLAEETFLNNGKREFDNLVTAVTYIWNVRFEPVVNIFKEMNDAFLDAAAVKDERVGDHL